MKRFWVTNKRKSVHCGRRDYEIVVGFYKKNNKSSERNGFGEKGGDLKKENFTAEIPYSHH